jgi:hypothetical protein
MRNEIHWSAEPTFSRRNRANVSPSDFLYSFLKSWYEKFSGRGFREIWMETGDKKIDESPMKTIIATICWAPILCVLLGSCAGPMNDTLGKQAYQAWAPPPKPGATPLSFLPPEPTTVADRDAFIFHMKEVKDYEYDNYVLNLRRGTGWGEVGSDSVKIILDSLVAVTGNASTKAALGAASAGVTGATTSIKKNVLFDQTITTFITAMDAARLSKWNDILCKMGRGGDSGDCKQPGKNYKYTVAEAFNDLQ